MEAEWVTGIGIGNIMFLHTKDMSDSDLVSKVTKQFELAKNKRELFVDLYEDCFQYTLPYRESFHQTSAGQRRDSRIFDETAVVGVQEFASRLQSGLVPNFARWADFVAGSEVPPDEKDDINNDLDAITEYVFEILQNSNFSQEIHECFIDLAIGTAVLYVEEGDAIHPVRFSAIPIPHVVLDTGPDDRVDHVYRERAVKYSDIEIAYPKAKISPELKSAIEKNPDSNAKIIELVCKDYSVRNEDQFFCYVCDTATKSLIKKQKFKGIGSNPFIAFRWGKYSGEIYGRGPVCNALSAIKTVNEVKENILENAAMAISGIYQMDDDGIINPDTINLVPGSVIPKSPNSMGLQPIKPAGNIDFSNFILNDERLNIKAALYNDMLGDPNKTPASATEVVERMADLSKRMGAAFGRVQSEMVQPVLQRVVYILKKQGRIDMPVINGREVKVTSVSPLAQAQNNQDIQSVARFLELVGTNFGPEMVNLLVKSEDVAVYLAKKFAVPDNLVRDQKEREEMIQMMQQMQMQQQQMEQQMQQQGQAIAAE